MERGNEVGQPAAAPATTANVGTVSNSVDNMSADVGGVDMSGLNISVAGGAAGGGAKRKDDGSRAADPDDADSPPGSGPTGA
ncbi:MAG: hypothetical protein ABIQ73_13860 [Acidimicrobiales bacterium]